MLKNYLKIASRFLVKIRRTALLILLAWLLALYAACIY